jgi:hypothetical protein
MVGFRGSNLRNKAGMLLLILRRNPKLTAWLTDFEHNDEWDRRSLFGVVEGLRKPRSSNLNSGAARLFIFACSIPRLNSSRVTSSKLGAPLPNVMVTWFAFKEFHVRFRPQSPMPPVSVGCPCSRLFLGERDHQGRNDNKCVSD